MEIQQLREKRDAALADHEAQVAEVFEKEWRDVLRLVAIPEDQKRICAEFFRRGAGCGRTLGRLSLLETVFEMSSKRTPPPGSSSSPSRLGRPHS